MASEPFESEGPGPLWLLLGYEGAERGGAGRPLVCELLDRAAVAARIAQDHRPGARSGRLATSMRLAEADAVAWVAFLVALHGLGKASPGYQARDPLAALRLRAAGFRVDARAGRDPAAVTAREVRRVLRERFGLGPFLAARLGHVVAGVEAAESTRGYGLRDGAPEWGLARDVLVAHVARFTGVARIGPPSEELADDDGAFEELAWLVAETTRITADRDRFPPTPLPGTVDEYAPVARDRARAAVEAWATR